MQLNLFSAMEGNYKIEKPIRLIEFFAGIGAQHKALSVLGVPFESYKICEWAYNSIIAYNAIHIKDKTDYSKDLTKEQLIEYLEGNISTDYNSPCDCSKKPLEWLKNAYNNCKATHNLMNVMKTKGKDLEIVDKDKYEYILTYSFPCQDLSLAGKRKGMSVSQAEGGTRSGLLWEIERILTELSLSLSLPQILIMENVPEIIGSANIKDFQKWEMRLEQLGYRNHIEILNAKDYGIPQNRRRCFMVSILDEGNYEFGSKLPLQYKLKDFLEQQVDEKYFLSNKMIEYIVADNDKWEGNNGKSLVNKSIASTINTGEGSRRCDASNYICEDLPEDCDIKQVILIKNATKKGYLEAEEGDGIDISGRMEYHRGNVQKGLSQTLLTGGVNVGVVVKEKSSVVKTLKLMDDVKNGKYDASTCYGKYLFQSVDFNDSALEELAPTIKASKVDAGVIYNLRIRKLTPKECCRLMGFEDKDYETMKEAGLSDSAIYHCCGDSIVVSVLISICSQLFEDINEKDIIYNYVKKYFAK